MNGNQRGAQAPSFFQTVQTGEGDDWLRLHLNECAWGAPSGAVEAIAEEAHDHACHYPDPSYRQTRAALARHFDVTPDMVTVGNGVDELVLLSSLAFLRGADAEVTITAHTFPGYSASADVAGARVNALPLRDRRVPTDRMAGALADGTDLAFVCNPLNPTGALLDADEVDTLLRAAGEASGVLAFDEAYLDFADPEHHHALAAVRDGARALVLRTFSKAWGLASVRLGCVVGPPELVAALDATARALPFRVNRPVERALFAALDHPGHLDRVRAETARSRELLVKGLAALGLTTSPSVSNFVMVDVPGDSAEVARRLADEHRVLVRDLSLLGTPGSLRITVGTPSQVERCVTALAGVLDRAV